MRVENFPKSQNPTGQKRRYMCSAFMWNACAHSFCRYCMCRGQVCRVYANMFLAYMLLVAAAADSGVACMLAHYSTYTLAQLILKLLHSCLNVFHIHSKISLAGWGSLCRYFGIFSESSCRYFGLRPPPPGNLVSLCMIPDADSSHYQ